MIDVQKVKAGPGLIQGNSDGNDVDFDDDVFLDVCDFVWLCWRLCGKGWPSYLPISNYIKTLSSNSRNGGSG